MLNISSLERVLLYFAITIFLFACRSSSGLSPAMESEMKAEAKLALENYYEDVRSLGPLAEFKWLDSSSSFFWLPPGYSSPIDYDSVARFIRAHAPAIRKMDQHWEALQIQPLSAEFVSYSGRLHSVTVDAGGVSHSARLVETGILVKRAGGWKLLCGQTNALPEDLPAH